MLVLVLALLLHQAAAASLATIVGGVNNGGKGSTSDTAGQLPLPPEVECQRRHAAKCTELETGLGSFMARNELTQVVVWGHKSRGTHRWIHHGVFNALVTASGGNISIAWTEDSSPPPRQSLVVATLAGTPHGLAVAPLDLTSRYILLVNKGGDTYPGANHDWITKIRAVLWAPYLPVTPNNVEGCLVQPWPGPATRCEVMPAVCVDESLAQRREAASRGGPAPAEHAVFVGSLWKPDQMETFLAVVGRLKQRHNISTIHYGWCKECMHPGEKDVAAWAAAHGFESRDVLGASEARLAQQRAFMSFDLRYSYHLDHEYVPDRWFKLAAAGKLVVTNSESAKALFGDAAVAERDVPTMVDKAVALSRDQRRLVPALRRAAEVVREQHTYSHRMRTLLTMLPDPAEREAVLGHGGGGPAGTQKRSR